MTNSTLLREVIKKSGFKYGYIAKQMNITPYGLQKKIDNKTEFKASEVKILCDLLGINDLNERERIFFTSEVDLNSTKGALADTKGA